MKQSATTTLKTARHRPPFLASTRDIAYEEAEMKLFHSAPSMAESTAATFYHFPGDTFSELTLAFLYRYGPYMDRHDLDSSNVAKRTRSFEITNPDHPGFDSSFPAPLTFSKARQARKLWATTEIASWAHAHERAQHQKPDVESL